MGFGILFKPSQERVEPRFPNLRSATAVKGSLSPNARFEIHVPQGAVG